MLHEVGQALWTELGFIWKPSSLEMMYAHWMPNPDRANVFESGVELRQRHVLISLGRWVDHTGGCAHCTENTIRSGDKLWCRQNKAVTCTCVPLGERVPCFLCTPYGGVEYATEAWRIASEVAHTLKTRRERANEFAKWAPARRSPRRLS